MAEDADRPSPDGRLRLDVLQDGVADEAERRGVPVTLSVLCDNAAEVLGNVAVAVSVPAVGTGMDTLAAAGASARIGEELQVTVGQGPSLEVLHGSVPLVVEDLSIPLQQARWPLFAPAAVEAGICAVCAVPMRIGAARFGVFVVYSDRPGGWTPTGLGDAVLFAALALELLLDHLEAAGHRDGRRPGGTTGGGPVAGRFFGGRGSFDDRPEIHQATGMVAAQLGVDLPTALLRMRARAFSDGRLLSDLAADVVARRLRFTPESDEQPDPG